MVVRTAIVALLACLAGTAQAQDPGWYLGAAAGRSDFNSRSTGQFDWRVDEDYTDGAFAAYGGYRFGRHVAIEAAYTDLGGYGFTGECPGIVCVPEAYPYDYTLDARQLDVSVMGILPFGEQWDIYAKVGRTRSDYEVTWRSLLETFSGSTHAYDVSYGLGIRYRLNPAWKLRLQAQRTSNVGSGSVDFDAYLLGVEYGFGIRRHP